MPRFRHAAAGPLSGAGGSIRLTNSPSGARRMVWVETSDDMNLVPVRQGLGVEERRVREPEPQPKATPRLPPAPCGGRPGLPGRRNIWRQTRTPAVKRNGRSERRKPLGSEGPEARHCRRHPDALRARCRAPPLGPLPAPREQMEEAHRHDEARTSVPSPCNRASVRIWLGSPPPAGCTPPGRPRRN